MVWKYFDQIEENISSTWFQHATCKHYSFCLTCTNSEAPDIYIGMSTNIVKTFTTLKRETTNCIHNIEIGL